MLPPHLRKFLYLLISLAIVNPQLLSAQGASTRIVLKLKEEAASKIAPNEDFKIKSTNGRLWAGDAGPFLKKNDKDLLQFKRMFPHAGKHEERHRAFGLHLWYEQDSETNPSEQKLTEKVAELKKINLFEEVYLEENIQSNFFSKPSIDDSLFAKQWNFDNQGQTKGTAGADIGLINALQLEKGSKKVIVSIHDSGYDSLHADVTSNLWVNEGEIPNNGIDDDNNGYIDDVHGWNFASNNNDLQDRNGHGTFIAGIIGAKANDNGIIGIAGGDTVDNGVQLMICRLDWDTPELVVTGMERSIVYAADNGSIISSNSWNSFGRSHSVLTALEYYRSVSQSDLMESGLIVFSAGNSGLNNQRYEKENPNVMMVGSTDHKDVASDFTNYGDWLDLVAPGEDIFSHDINGSFRMWSGTSFSAPHLAGVAALVLSKFGHEKYTLDSLRSRILAGCEDVDSLSFGRYAGKLGAGRLNAFKALLTQDSISPARPENLTISKIHSYWADLEFVAPFDNTIAPFQYIAEVNNIETNSKQIAHFDVEFPKESELLTFKIDSISPLTDYSLNIKSLDYFGNESGWSDTVFFTTIGKPILVVDEFETSHNFQIEDNYTTSFHFSNKGESELDWSIKLKRKGLFDRFNMKITTYNRIVHDEAASIVVEAGGSVSPLDSLFLEYELQKTNALILDENIHRYDSIRIAQLKNWVKRGGTAIIGIFDFGIENANQLLADLGIQFNTYPSESNVYINEANFNLKHPLTSGLTQLYLYNISTYLTFNESGDIETILFDDRHNPHLVVAKSGKGEFIISNGYFFQDYQLGVADNYQLLENTLKYINLNSSAIIHQSSGTLGISESANIQINFNHNLGPVYRDTLVITSNDELAQTTLFPFELTIRADGRPSLNKNFLYFDTTYVGYPSKMAINVQNEGLDELSVEFMGSEIFSLGDEPQSASLSPGEYFNQAIHFNPTSTSFYSDTIQLIANNELITIPVSGNGLIPPKLLLSTGDTLLVNSNEKRSIKKQIRLSNKKQTSDLRYTIELIESEHSILKSSDPGNNLSNKLIAFSDLNRYDRALKEYPFYPTNEVVTFRNNLANNPYTLDSLDVLVLDQNFASLAAKNISLIKEWVHSGGNLILQTNETYSSEKLNSFLEMTSASGFGTEKRSSIDTTYHVFLHPITEGVSDIIIPTFTDKYIITEDVEKVLLRDRKYHPYMIWDNYGEGKVVIFSNIVFTTLPTHAPFKRLINQTFNWFFSDESFWVHTPSMRRGSLKSGENATIEIEVETANYELLTREVIFRISSNDPDSTHRVVLNMNPINYPDNNLPTVPNDTVYYSIHENPANGHTVGYLESSDKDGDVPFFFIADDLQRIMVESGGKLYVNDTSFFDFENATTYTTSYGVTDLKDTTMAYLTITIENVNESPMIDLKNGNVYSFAEDSFVDIPFSVFDQDNDKLSITTSEIGNSLTNHVLTEGNVRVSGQEDAFGMTEFVITASDSEISIAKNISIDIVPVNDAPLATNHTFELHENNPKNFEIGELVCRDPDGDELTYFIEDEWPILLNASTGIISIKDALFFDFEENEKLEIDYYLTDQSDTSKAKIVLLLLDVNESPIIGISSELVTIEEDAILMLPISVSDPENNALTISAEETYGPLFKTIDWKEGFLTGTLSQDIYGSTQIRITANDGHLTSSTILNIEVLPMNDKPEAIDAIFSIEENSSNGSVVGFITADDVDDEELNYVLYEVKVNNSFSIDLFTGLLTVADSTFLDFETNPAFQLNYYVIDNSSALDSATITINLIDVLEAPLFVSSTSDFIIYPNPTSDKIVVIANRLIRLELYDLTGRQQITSNSNQMDLSALSEGLYTLKIISIDSSESYYQIIKK